MSHKSKSACAVCETEGKCCDKKRPKCTRCIDDNVACTYPLTLKWGGRPYKDKTKQIKIPKNTVLVDGVLMVRDKRHLSPSRYERRNRLILINEGPAFPKRTTKCGVRKAVEDVSEKSAIQITNSCCFTPQGSMPSLKLLNCSLEHSIFFEFYVYKTSHHFVALNKDCKSNPFHTIVPQMAMFNPSLMKLVMAFGGEHRERLRRLGNQQSYYSLDEDFVVRKPLTMTGQELLKQGVTELVDQLASSKESIDDTVLASVLVLASFCIYFGTIENKWHAHLQGAEGIILRELKEKSKIEKGLLRYTCEQGPYYFLRRWFAYMRIWGCISSASFRQKAAGRPLLEIDFEETQDPQNHKNGHVDYALYTSGVESLVLSYLAQVANLILKLETRPPGPNTQHIFRDAVELEYKIMNYLASRKQEGEASLRHFFPLTGSVPCDSAQQYSILIATNMLFGLTGVLQLRRRVLGLTHESLLVQNLVLKITELIEKRLSAGTFVQPCLLFCFFSCGCELLDESLVPKRPLFLKLLNSLIKDGVESARQARSAMKECWRTFKPWWEVLKERGLDICFAI
ncbi:LAQU0S31e00166g1_1 [Lachancea quebecensis]|uniref:LAQU0S31e00166g1_1 n=1 Tax=Lachancea quebecensis TaxID=1654605 RepID=A0A0N7MMI1_9SACH|nr:LAQU0S31e00166g1_1 [Lachancea quebecensis]